MSRSVSHEQNQSGKLCKNCEEMKQLSLQLINLLMAHWEMLPPSETSPVYKMVQSNIYLLVEFKGFFKLLDDKAQPPHPCTQVSPHPLPSQVFHSALVSSSLTILSPCLMIEWKNTWENRMSWTVYLQVKLSLRNSLVSRRPLKSEVLIAVIGVEPAVKYSFV